MQKILCWLLCCYTTMAVAQPYRYTTANAHSHNDYEHPIPFWVAYNEGFGSIEADVHLVNDSLLVAHTKVEPGNHHTLEDLYLKPLQSCVARNNGYPYADHSRKLQLLIDVKTDSLLTLNKIISTISQYPQLANNGQIRFVITGGRPVPEKYSSYPSFIWFDGNLGETYPADALPKIAMLSADFHKYAAWNGKSNIPEKEVARLRPLIEQAHALGKPVRFWASPDIINAWYQLMKLQVDFLNTDRITELSAFLSDLPRTSFRNDQPYNTYTPSYASDGSSKKAKNIILLIGDGTGLAQLYTGYTANHGQLNIFGMRHIGLSKTSSYNNYITDSAPGSTSIASGVKTNNRFVGVDHTGRPLPLLPYFLAQKKITTGLVTAGDVTDATPADFYAHRMERDSSAAIFHDLATAPVQLLMGSGNKSFSPGLRQELQAHQFQITTAVDSVPANTTAKWLVMEPKAGLPAAAGRGNWLEQAFAKTLGILSRGNNGFFIMTEGAQIDHGGHDNNLPYIATEVMDFDQVVGKALQFADQDGETLVIVTADHETSGLSLLDGDYTKGYVSGRFSTNDHTAIPVPVFAYGPQSQLFNGVYENTALFGKILAALGIQAPGK